MIRASTGKGRRVAGIDVKDISGGFRGTVRGKEIHRRGNILRVHTAFQQAAFPVEVLELFFLELISLSALCAPLPAPNLGAAQYCVGVDDVDSNAVRGPFERQA